MLSKASHIRYKAEILKCAQNSDFSSNGHGRMDTEGGRKDVLPTTVCSVTGGHKSQIKIVSLLS